ncbi:hypothetical protein COY59_02710 [Candidatus Gottesmanbacteria bacterium CG_4_10_14_0_8_um_filter_37_24]|uniref:peptidylprolyl isomerase n=1 Tax=Candidatus Gottesmanbacteria bacterium CG_4_10_14_0_8_um_filter_37_24 TaxID=1974574 RepID=A0A2M7RS19_9BACT|nr:MAG: hypothetical protein COX23_05215 [Candidatus Gottesmanbacteria bacterium CG23_combo_of_CG06-09_8_20_14_all_37_19]PIZ02849.1 MAG: hypothetical protein COY59_02710 [Candidatus Gottesmanbacteria bacterium CG_4_10_14_0_8_um_filter_37_24]
MVRKSKITSSVKEAKYRENLKENNISSTKGFPLSSFLTVKNIILVLLLVVIVLLWKFKGNFIAATVNGQPISKWQLNSELEKKFGGQVLDAIINERLILGATRQKGIFVTSPEIDKKIEEIEKQLNGKVSLDDALKSQGMTKDDFRKQLEIQISINKMFDKDASISSKEIDDYLESNSSLSKDATDPAALRSEVTDILKQQKVSDLFNEWFAKIRNDAKITKFL